MRWPWTHGRLGAIELEARKPVFVTIVSTDRRVIEGTENPDRAKSLIERLITYMKAKGQAYSRPADPGVFPLTASQNRLYGFPDDAVGTLLFKRVFRLEDPRLDVVQTLAQVPSYRSGLVRIEMVGPGNRSMSTAASMTAEEREVTRWQRAGARESEGIVYAFGYPDGKFRVVLPNGQILPYEMARLPEAIQLMMGVYDPSR